jgi:hypothetical protein
LKAAVEAPAGEWPAPSDTRLPTFGSRAARAFWKAGGKKSTFSPATWRSAETRSPVSFDRPAITAST